MLENFYKESNNVSDTWNNVEISLLTYSKDDPLYSWFGHAGIMVDFGDGNQVIYDYGRFAFSKGFYINFVKGLLWYSCGGYYAYYGLNEAEQSGRTVSKVVLDLNNSQKQAVANFLNTNSSAPYNRYLYNHYYDNCATRLRDIINYATNGDFEAWAKSIPGYTFREQTSRILHHSMIVEWALDLLQGSNIDKEATLWDEMFLPENLEKGLLKYGKLTKSTEYITDFRGTDTRPINYEEPQYYISQSFIAGSALALLLLILRLFTKKGYVIETSIVNFVLSIVGCLMFYMDFLSNHTYSWNNENLLFISPIFILLFVFGIKPKKHKNILLAIYTALTLIVASMIAIKAIAPQILVQANMPQLVAVLPYYLANYVICLIEVYDER